MKTKQTLTLLAAALSATSSLHAQPETPETVTAILQQISAPAQPATATLEQRAAKLGALALIPADAESFAALPHATRSIRNLMSQPILRIGLADKLQEILAPAGMVTSAAVAAGPGTSEFLGKNIIQIATLFDIYDTCNIKKYLLDDKLQYEERQEPDTLDTQQKEQATRQRATRLRQGMLDINRNLLRSASPILSRMAPTMQNISITAIAELHPSTGALLEQSLHGLKEEISKSPGHFLSWHEGAYAGYDWQGVTFDGKSFARFIESEYKSNGIEPDSNERKGLEALSLVKLHCLVTVRNGKALYTICSNPAKNINIAATPAESILATDKIAFADARLNNNPDFLFLIDKSAGQGIAEGIAALAGQLDADAYPQSLPVQMDCLSKLYQSISSGNIAGTMWADKGIHLEITQGAIAALDLNSPLQLLPCADHPETMLYGECTATPLVGSLLSAMLDDDMKAATALTSPLHWPKEAADIWNNAKTVFSGMNGKTALLIDNKGSLPSDYPDKEIVAYNIAMPRAALYMGIGDPQRISSAWNSIWTSCGTMAKSQALPLQTVSRTAPGIAIYRLAESSVSHLAFPDKGPNETFFGPSDQILRDSCIALSGNAIVIGLPETYAADIAMADEAPPSSLKGAAFALRIAPIRDLLARNDAYLIGKNKEFAGMLTAMYTFIASQLDGLYGITTSENGVTRTRIYLRAR